MNDNSTGDITKLLDPIDILAFQHTYEGSEWTFPGAKVSTKVFQDEGCSLNMGESLITMNGNLLSLSEHTALLYLAFSYYKGEDLSQIPSKSLEGAKSIFYNNLYLSLTTSNPGAHNQFFFGEAHNDIIELGEHSNKYIKSTWYQNPIVTQTEPLKYYAGENTKVIQIKIPNLEGVAVKTSDGYLNPETGIPFETNPKIRENSKSFLSEIARAILNKNGESITKGEDLISFMFGGPLKLKQILSQGFSLDEIKNEIGEALDLLKPVYRISHNFENKPLIEYGSKTLLTMRGIDEIVDFFVPVLGYVGPHCGMQPRSIRRY